MTKKAKWVRGVYDFKKFEYVVSNDKSDRKYLAIICSNCKTKAYDDSDLGAQIFPYCPYCGAEMENGDADTYEI